MRSSRRAFSRLGERVAAANAGRSDRTEEQHLLARDERDDGRFRRTPARRDPIYGDAIAPFANIAAKTPRKNAKA